MSLLRFSFGIAALCSTSLLLAEENAPPLDLNTLTQQTLARSTDIRIGRLQVLAAQAGAQAEQGAFDTTGFINATFKHARAPLYVGDFDGEGTLVNVRDNRDIQELEVGLSKRFSIGLNSRLSVKLSRDDPRSVAPPPPPIITNNKTATRLRIDIPLLKGRGETGFSAEATAAELEARAAQVDLYHGISQVLLAAVQAYWNYKAAVETLALHERSKARVQEWMQGITLAATDPARLQVQGRLSEKQGKIINATEQVQTARSELALAMGIPLRDMHTLGAPVSDFKGNWLNVATQFDPQTARSRWMETALKQRFDIQATQLRLEAANVQLEKARLDELPTLNLTLAVGHNGLAVDNGWDQYWNSWDSYVKGADWGTALVFRYTFDNAQARGAFQVSHATQRQRLLDNRDLERTLRVELGIATSQLHQALQATVSIAETIQAYYTTLQSLKQEPNAFNNPTSLFNLLEQEDKLVTALEEEIKIYNALANAIVQIRFQTGVLINTTTTEAEVELSNVNELPQ